MIGNLKQVSLYFGDAAIRETAKQKLLSIIRDDTKVVIGHSLGSIVAYEALCELASRPVQTFITIGSPLGLDPIFSKLNPAPKDGFGKWPTGAAAWTNIAATRDPVAAIKQLAPLFGDRVVDKLIDNETQAHDVVPYLTARETGEAIASGLGGSA
jgi:pimeloyl-ACP methyl ester carboxylesterase